MKAQKITPIVFPASRQRMFRYVLAVLNSAALVGAIGFVMWILGKMIGALHTLVFSLVLPATPDLSPNQFPILEDFNARGEVYSIVKNPDNPFDGRTVYTVNHKDWDK